MAAGEAEPGTKGSVVASDAFFPFADGLLAAAEAGVTAVIQPGGSVRECIAALEELGASVVAEDTIFEHLASRCDAVVTVIGD